MTKASYTLLSLPPEVQAVMLTGHRVTVAQVEAHRKAIRAKELESGGGLFSGSVADRIAAPTEASPIIWATEATDGTIVHKFTDTITPSMLANIKPRVDKSKEEQKRRVKTKAEVFTPSWVCNLQNNLIDGATLYEGAFNTTEGPASKDWTPSSGKVKFTADYTWAHYVTENRLEMTCGEAPYLASRYDTVTGNDIPVKSERGWERIGLLDRKLRVVSENVEDEAEWLQASLYALRATYGFEWQGDNLLLARLNLLNTMEDYYRVLWGKGLTEAQLLEVAEILSWNIWQMDGLKMVQPESCSPACSACAAKARGGHDGLLSAVRFGLVPQAFESLLPGSMIAAPSKAQAGKKTGKKDKGSAETTTSAQATSLFG